MAKNLTTYQPGAKKASSDLTYKTMHMPGAWGEDGGNSESTYGEMRNYVNRDDTACRGNFKLGDTDVVLTAHAGQGGGACCCQSSSPGRSATTVKYTPIFGGDSDHMYFCNRNSCGCCRPQCNGEPGYSTRVCHTSGGHGGTAINYVCAGGGCGAASVCNWGYNACCNYAKLLSGGGRDKLVCPDGQSEKGFGCYTTCSEERLTSCDAGIDCVYCIAPGNYGYESGSCINRSAEGICGVNFWSNIANWRTSAFRNGVVEINAVSGMEQANGGFNYNNHHHCNLGYRANTTGFWSNGVSYPGASACGGACCCGTRGTAGQVIIRYEEDES